jgi:hypothetical protein
MKRFVVSMLLALAAVAATAGSVFADPWPH